MLKNRKIMSHLHILNQLTPHGTPHFQVGLQGDFFDEFYVEEVEQLGIQWWKRH